MFARLTMFQVKSDKLGETIKRFQESVIPAAKSRKGFHGGYLLTDRKTGKCVSVALWDSEEDIIADEQSGHYQERVSIGKESFTTPPVREIYEVSVQA